MIWYVMYQRADGVVMGIAHFHAIIRIGILSEVWRVTTLQTFCFSLATAAKPP
jgi:hypothetical protein